MPLRFIPVEAESPRMYFDLRSEPSLRVGRRAGSNRRRGNVSLYRLMGVHLVDRIPESAESAHRYVQETLVRVQHVSHDKFSRRIEIV